MISFDVPKSQSIDDPTVGITTSPLINATAPDTSSDSQPIQNQNVGDTPKNLAVISQISLSSNIRKFQ
jgi:hypothetical protein